MSVTSSLYPPDYEQVPTCDDLLRQGLARELTSTRIDRSTGNPKTDTRVQISAAGQQLIYDAMARNAARGRAWNAQRLVNAASDGNEL